MASSFEAELKRKTVDAEEAAALVKSGQWIDYGFGIGQPDVFDRALASRIPQLTGLKIRGTLALKPRAAIEADPEGRRVAYYSWYFSGLERKLHDRELCSHIPMNFGEAPDYYRRFVDVDIAIANSGGSRIGLTSFQVSGTALTATESGLFYDFSVTHSLLYITNFTDGVCFNSSCGGCVVRFENTIFVSVVHTASNIPETGNV